MVRSWRSYGIAVRVLFRWNEAMNPEPIFASVQVRGIGGGI
jgi:hypothetical protein